jgi:hypothetical protein
LRPGNLLANLDISQAEAAVEHNLRPYLEGMKGYEHHWQSLRRQHDEAERQIVGLADFALFVQLDYKENDSVPQGPDEGGDWYWATSRLPITTLGFFTAWREHGKMKERYFYFVSSVLEHSCLFAIMCFQRVLQELHAERFKFMCVWTDCGPHFRAYEFAAYVLATVPKDFKFHTSLIFLWKLTGRAGLTEALDFRLIG